MPRWIMVIFLSVLVSFPAFADVRSANRQTFFNKTTDLLATVGKSPDDTAAIHRKRHNLRRKARLEADKRRKKGETQKLIKKQKRDRMRRIQSNS